MNICVFGSASPTIDAKYLEKGKELGEILADRRHTLLFGAGTYGMMGAVARGAYGKNGKIIGIVPKFFVSLNVLFKNCDKTILTETMHERKNLLVEQSDGFIITPGGIGTMDEFFEVFTLKQLGQIHAPIVIFNTYGFYDKLKEMLNEFVEKDVLSEDSCKKQLYFTDDSTDAINFIEKAL